MGWVSVSSAGYVVRRRRLFSVSSQCLALARRHGADPQMRQFWSWLGKGRLTQHIGVLLFAFLIFAGISFVVSTSAKKVMLGAPIVWMVYLALHFLAKNANEL